MMRAETLPGVIVEDLPHSADHRGWLVETFRIDRLPEDVRPVMSYVNMTRPGMYRGPHEHRERIEIFAFPGPGEGLLTLWDNRAESGTFGRKMVVSVGGTQPRIVVIPPGIVHVVENISTQEDLLLVNYPTTLFRGWGRDKEFTDEIRYENDGSSFWNDFVNDRNGR